MADRASDDEPKEGEPRVRLPYERPKIAWEQPLAVRPELMAGCSKVSTSDPQCDSGLSS
ncbi:MAG TPA: hypothetical protein VMT70_04180 [Vicinamibacteria bacterium]|nr:hypothetical protein [Vicinamibacteria bacterium]